MNPLKSWDRLYDLLGGTFLHPQYFVISPQKQTIKIVLSKIKGRVLDIGCGRQLMRDRVSEKGFDYVSLDHPKIYKRQRGNKKPDILSDITNIPVKNNSFDSAFILMVMAHLPMPFEGIKEVYRILKPKGLILISTVENYPAHDLPDDYFRYRSSGLEVICKNAGFKIVKSYSWGNFWQVNSLNFNVFLMQTAKLVLDKTSSIPLTALLVIVFYPLTIISNLIAILLGPLDFVKSSHLINFVVAQKNA